MADLIITNGDSAADLLAAAGKPGVILPWRDVLHEGPIVGGALEQCSEMRAAYLANRLRLDQAEIASGFAERDALLRKHESFERIELWFEHDLYDQLQLVQLLAFFAGVSRSEGLVMVQADDFLGAQRVDTILRFAGRARPVELADLELGETVWQELATPTPEAIADRTTTDDRSLPFLKAALLRFLAELPSPGNGLGRTEQAILEAIDGGATTAVKVFHETIKREEAPFMGDISLYGLIEDLTFCEVPLITGLAPRAAGEDALDRIYDAALELTMAGEDVLAGEEDHVALSGIDRWWGGTWLVGRDPWRYDREKQRLVSPAVARA